jgi:predicted DNA-binding protein (MmcQ/YjbR family)
MRRSPPLLAARNVAANSGHAPVSARIRCGEIKGISIVVAKNAVDNALAELRAFGLAYPGTHLKSPWPGHKDLAVNDKTFAYLGIEGDPLSISCKLPQSHAAVLMLEHTSPTAYGLGKSGWVTAQFPKGVVPPLEMLKSWIAESYRAQAPKKLLAKLAESPTAGANAAAKAKPQRTKPAARKPASTRKKKSR